MDTFKRLREGQGSVGALPCSRYKQNPRNITMDSFFFFF